MRTFKEGMRRTLINFLYFFPCFQIGSV